MKNMSFGKGKTPTQRFLFWFWDCIDISENMVRVEKKSREHVNGLGAWWNVAAMLTLTLFSLVLAWKFDFESTLIGMSTLRDTVLTDLPASVLKFSTFIVVALTIAPTVIELFTGAFARADVKIMQLYVIGFTGFDLVTDIPRAMTFTNQMQANFDLLGALSGIGYWAFFLVWLFFATIGFELVLVLTGYLTIIYVFKAFAVEEPVRPFSKSASGSMPKQTVVDVGDMGEKIKV